MNTEATEMKKRESPALGKTIGKIAGIIDHGTFPTGDRAALKRMSPGVEPPLTFYRFCFQNMEEGWEWKKEEWLTIIAGIALMCPNPHNYEKSAGMALASWGYSEKRLERLFASSGEVLRLLTLRAARFLSAKNESINWVDFARLLLSETPEKRENARMKIARDFYKSQKPEG